MRGVGLAAAVALLAGAAAAPAATPDAGAETAGASPAPAGPPPANTSADTPPRLTVEDAVRLARRRHPSVEAQRAAIAGARARVLQAQAAFLPFFTASLAYEPQTANLVQPPALRQTTNRGVDTIIDPTGRPIRVFCTDPGEGTCMASAAVQPSLTLHSYWLATLGIAWTPWDWGRSIYGYHSARWFAGSAETGLTTTERDVALNARLAFFGAVAADEQVAVAEESVATYRKQLDQTQAFYDSGLRTKIDVATAESGLAAAELTLARAYAGRGTARSALTAALGEQDWPGWRLIADPQTFEVQPTDVARATAPDPTLTDTALRQRSELHQLGQQARAYADLARAQRGQYLPQLTFGINPQWAGATLPSMVSNLVFNIVLSYPTNGMSPFLVRGQIHESEANLAATRALDRATRNGIRQETSDAHALLSAASEEVRAARALVEAADAQRALAIGRYATGVGTIIELQNALLNDVAARFQRVQAGYDLASARARLQHALGEDG
jgi:outer membrane protein